MQGARVMANIRGRQKPDTSHLSELKNKGKSINALVADPLHKKKTVVYTANGAENRTSSDFSFLAAFNGSHLILVGWEL